MSAFTTGICAHKVRRTAQATKRERVEENGYVIYRRVADGLVTADVEIWIDYTRIIRQLADRAILSKGKKSQALSGAIVVTARNLKRIPA